MTLQHVNPWGIAAGLSAVAALTASVLWFIYRKRPTAEELERARRQMLVQSGRIVDGMLLDVREVEAEDGRTLTMLLFSYRNGGVNYECSQDITDMPKTPLSSRKNGVACAPACLSSLYSKNPSRST